MKLLYISVFSAFIATLFPAFSLAHKDIPVPTHPQTLESTIPSISINSNSGNTPWTRLTFNNKPKSFQFAVVTDRTGGARKKVFEDAINKLNLLQPEFVVSVGDLIEGGTENRNQILAEWNEFDGFVNNLKMPFFYVAGNHDYSNPVMADIWKERYGPSYYYFVYKDVLFVMMNSNDGGGVNRISEKQIAWLSEVLNSHPEPKWTLLFIHAPLWDRENEDHWPQVDKLLQNRKYTVFAGHHHSYVKQQRYGHNYFTLATTGGGSSLRGNRYGEFDHVLWVTITEDGPILANLMLSGIWPDDIRDEELRSKQKQLIDSEALSLPPLYYRGQFHDGVSELRLSNKSDTPYQLELTFNQIDNVLLLSERQKNITVLSNEVKVVPIQIVSPDPIIEDKKIVRMDWKLSFEHHTQQIEYEGDKELLLVKELPIKESSELNVEIDGDLAEWKGESFQTDSAPPMLDLLMDKNDWKGNEDASFEWAIIISGQQLLFAINIKDDHIVRTQGNGGYQQDNVQLAIDVGQKFVISLFPPHGEYETLLNDKQPTPKGIQYHAIETDKGYSVEISIPIKALNKTNDGKWDSIKTNIAQIDIDPQEKFFVQREWKPTWPWPNQTPEAIGILYRK